MTQEYGLKRVSDHVVAAGESWLWGFHVRARIFCRFSVPFETLHVLCGRFYNVFVGGDGDATNSRPELQRSFTRGRTIP